jgi:ABC-type uncharacterized transport system substrate-binding protein
MPGCAFGERRILLGEFIRESELDWRGLAKALSAQLLENRVPLACLLRKRDQLAIAPRVNRIAVLYDPDNRTSLGQLPEIEARAPLFALRVSSSPVRNVPEIEHAFGAFAGEVNGGLIVLPGPVTVVHRKLIIALATKHRLPSVYAYRFDVTSGGLASYGVDVSDLYRRAASYVDRIFKGEKPGELPVQFATKFELLINLKTAKALNLDVLCRSRKTSCSSGGAIKRCEAPPCQ